MLIHKLPQTPYTAFPLEWQIWAQENMFILHSANVFRDERWTLLGNQILHRRSGIISIRVTHPCLYKCLQVHVIANARLVRFVLVRLSPNSNTNTIYQIQTRQLQMEDANKKCGNIRRDSYSTESSCRRGVAWWRNSEPCINRTLCRNTTGWVCLQDILTVSVCHK